MEYETKPLCQICGEEMYKAENSATSDTTLRYVCTEDNNEAVWIAARTATDAGRWEQIATPRSISGTA